MDFDARMPFGNYNDKYPSDLEKNKQSKIGKKNPNKNLKENLKDVGKNVIPKIDQQTSSTQNTKHKIKPKKISDFAEDEEFSKLVKARRPILTGNLQIQKNKTNIFDETSPKTSPVKAKEQKNHPQMPQVREENVKGIDNYGMIISEKGLNFQKTSSAELKRLQSAMQNINRFYENMNIDSLSSDFQPVNKITIGNATYYCSNPIMLHDDHVGVVALVEIEGKVFPRVFYESQSQASWRVAPGIDKSKGYLGYLNKGGGESSTQLPTALIGALHNLNNERKTEGRPLPELTVEDSHPLVRSMNKYSFLPGERVYQKGSKSTQMDISFMGLTKMEDIEVTGKGFVEKYSAPDTVGVADPKMLPDFNKPKASFQINSDTYGPLNAHIFMSHNGNLQYMICEDKSGRAFIANIEIIKHDNEENPINKYGVRSWVAMLRQIDMPLMEYGSMIDEHFEAPYFAESNTKKGNYYSTWNYIREIPVIKAYYESQGRQVPPRV